MHTIVIKYIQLFCVAVLFDNVSCDQIKLQNYEDQLLFYRTMSCTAACLSNYPEKLYFSKGCAGILLALEESEPDPSPATSQLVRYALNNPNSSKKGAQTAHGITYPSLTASQAIGTEGHILLQDAFLLEKLQSFNKERIPERVVHAKGAGAFGHFKVTHDITKYTKAGFLQKVGQVTKVAIRFSTVGGESGSADTNVDPKGFATKFYTQDGIFDLVGNNIQVFPIRDPMLFVDLNRSRKRNPQTHLADPNSWWDVTSLRPEIALHTLHLFSDMGRPKSYTYMDGAGVHTFKMVNAMGVPVYVKFHWTSNAKNKHYYTPEESVQVSGSSPDALTKDLFDRIERKEYPSWIFSIQVMTIEQAQQHRQNPFDITKFWKTEEYPLIPVGEMILHENPKDYFTQVEEMAFSPSHMVPGIEPSPDRMLHARMFSYPDAQLYRLGVNFAQIPVNRCPFQVQTYQRDGHMNVGSNGAGAPNYFLNSFNGLPSAGSLFRHLKFNVTGDVARFDTGDEDNFSLAKYYLTKLVKGDERKRIVENIAAFLGQADKSVQRNYIKSIANNIGSAFGASLQEALKL